MARVIGVRFRDNGKIYYFASEQFEVEVGQNVIVETARGVEYGRVVLGNREIHDEKIIATLKPVIRIATPEDDKIQENNKEKSKEAYKICIEKIKKHKLAMKLIDCEYTFDNNKVYSQSISFISSSCFLIFSRQIPYASLLLILLFACTLSSSSVAIRITGFSVEIIFSS